MKTFIYAVLSFGAFTLMLVVLNTGIVKSEKNECYKWQEQAESYKDFYLLGWEAEQCRTLNIKVDAPTK